MLQKVELRLAIVSNQNIDNTNFEEDTSLEELSAIILKVIKSQDKLGRWIVHQDQFRKEVKGKRWDGEYRVEDRISSALFNANVAALCSFLEEYSRISGK